LASGFTSYEGGGISYNIPYAKKVPLERSIRQQRRDLSTPADPRDN
jgi:glutamate mutase epsilon subunit